MHINKLACYVQDNNGTEMVLGVVLYEDLLGKYRKSNWLKIRCPKGRAGSTPALGTTLNLT